MTADPLTDTATSPGADSSAQPPTDDSPSELPDGRFLYRWQLDALTAWLKCGRRGVIEAVTGSGKTNMAMAAVIDAHRRGLFVLIVVPSRVLIEQWYEQLSETLPQCRIGRLGDNHRDRPPKCDILITTRHSAASHRPVPPTDAGGLLVADECHGYGGGVLRKSLMGDYQERLGLTATLERSDDGVEKVIVPYFGGICYRYDFIAAIADGVCAQPRVAFVSVPLTEEERADYTAVEEKLVQARSVLRSIPNMPLDNFGDFLGAVNYLADNDAGTHGRAANDYLKAFSQRREIVATSTSKYEALGRFADPIKDAAGALIFTETVRAANHAVNRLDPYVDIEIITGDTGRKQREDILGGLRDGRLDVVAAPRVLDEGVDVPNANLGIVVSASRTRRQMIQRMGRILRRKEAGSGARFVIIFARGTLEDPTANDDRDGFLDEIEAIAEASRVFGEDQTDLLKSFLDYQGPAKITEPQRLGPFTPGPRATEIPEVAEITKALAEGDHDAWASVTAKPDDDVQADLYDGFGAAGLYAFLSYLEWNRTSWLHKNVWSGYADEPLSEPDYLDFEKTELPVIAKKKPTKPRLSTGESPVQMVAIDDGWGVRCVGCGVTSDPTPFKWQALDQTVECECSDW